MYNILYKNNVESVGMLITITAEESPTFDQTYYRGIGLFGCYNFAI